MALALAPPVMSTDTQGAGLRLWRWAETGQAKLRRSEQSFGGPGDEEEQPANHGRNNISLYLTCTFHSDQAEGLWNWAAPRTTAACGAWHGNAVESRICANKHLT